MTSTKRWRRCNDVLVLDLFSGIGGFSLGLGRAGFTTVAFCEIDPFCRRVLARHWPAVPIHEDIRELDGSRYRGTVDLVCGGFPCQDISPASLTRTGIDGERSGLWSEMHRVIGESQPRFVIVENSSALTYRGLGRVLADLAALGFDAEWHCIRAGAIGAPFAGDRVYLLASANTEHGEAGMGFRTYLRHGTLQRASAEFRSEVWMEATCRSARMGDGFSDHLDRRERTEVLGNAVVPQVVELIGRAIMSVNES